ncbi:MAG: type II toxin-antitoxin system RelB/DinJ family antitoxin [Desulfotignum sp.]
MAKTAMAHTRITPEIKAEAECIIKGLGLSISAAHELFYRQIITHKGLPFDLRILHEDTIMNITEIQKATQDVLAPFHFSSLEDAALTFLHLSSLAKLSEYRRDHQHFREKYGMSFESFKKKVDKKMNEESFEEEDDYMAWHYAHDALRYWEQKVQELEKCF